MKKFIPLLTLLVVLFWQGSVSALPPTPLPFCSDNGYVLTYSSSTGQYSCQAVSGVAANPGGSAGDIQTNVAGTSFGGLTPVRGAILYSNATPAWALLSKQTTGKVLTYNATDLIASAFTLAAPGTSGNLLISDGTNWTSATAPTWNQNTTGTAAGLTAQYVDWDQATGGSSIANKPTLGAMALGAWPGSGIPNSTGTAWGTSYTTSGTGTVLALVTSPVFVTPTLGAATATTINKVTITAPATSSTLTVADGKVFTVNNTVTLAAGADSIVATLPASSGTIAYSGTLTNGKWCVADSAGLIQCNQDTPTGAGTITAVGDITSGASFTAAVPGKTLVFNNATSGTVTLQAQTGALSTTTVSLPASSGTIVVGPANVPITFAGPSVARTITFPDAAITVARSDAGQTFAGVQVMTAPTFTTSIGPTVAGASTIGTTSAEWGNVYLTDAAVIYGQADQSNSLTSSATGWASNLIFTSNAGFAAKNGTSAGFIQVFEPSGSGANKFTVQSAAMADDLTWTLPTAAAGGTGYLVTANAAGALSYTDPATFSVAAGSSSIVTVGTVTTGIWNGTAVVTTYGGTGLASYTGGDTLYYASGTTLSKLAKGTAYQVKHMNSGATAPEWTSTLGATGTPLTKVWTTDLNVTNTPTVGGTSLSSIYLPLAGGTMTGRIITVTPAAGGSGYASINLPHGAAPTTNITNGDLWTTTTGLYARINGSTVGPFGTSTATIAGTIAASADYITTSQGTANTIQATTGTLNGSGLLTVTSMSAGTGTFTVSSAGAVVASGVTVSKSSGVAGDIGLYELNSTDTDAAGFRGPLSLTANTSYRGQFPNAKPTSSNMVLAWATSASGTGTPSDPYISAMSFVDLDDYLPLIGGTLTGKLVTATNGTAAGLNLTQSAADPSSPVNGDIWILASGLYARVAGATVGPFITNAGLISDTTYAASWDGVTDVAPSKNAVYDKIETLASLGANTFTADQTISTHNIVTDTTTGSKIGTATSQKLGFFNATPVIQQTGDLVTGLGNLGLVVSGTVALSTAATNATITDDTTTAATMYPSWVTTTTGNLPLKVSSTKLSFVPSTGILTATGFAGALTGNVTGNVSGTAATVTGATQASITSAANLVTVGALSSGSLAAGFTPVTVPLGGTGLAAGTEGGIPWYTTTTAMASSALLAANGVMIGGGVDAAPSTITPSTTTTHALFATAGAPAFRALATADLPTALPAASTMATSLTVPDVILTSVTAGARLTGGNGTLTIKGDGDGTDEDLTINLNVDNKASITTSTGVTTIDFSTNNLNLVTTGYILGGIKTVGKSADYTIGTDDAKEAYGGFFFNTDASTRTFTLPSAVAGMCVCVRNGQGVNQVLRLDAGAGDYIVLDGARTSASGEYVTATASVTNQICVVAYDATDWYVTSKIGTWTEE